MKTFNITAVVVALALGALICGQALADPLPGEVLKFQQLPLNNGQGPSVGGAPYPGHDELSTAYPIPNGAGFQGNFMADDFADNFSTPVVHVRWWGSYLQNQYFNGVPRFLISFESDMPFDPIIGASRPDQPLLNQVVGKGPLSPASGTFTEKQLTFNTSEDLYEYNAELAIPFDEKADTVYWLKIVALVDPATNGPIRWGWHDRDWSLKDTLASPVVVPGEHIQGTVVDTTGVTVPVWHFQDDSVSGTLTITQNPATGLKVDQANYHPEKYIFTPGAVLIDGPPGIEQYSKDLAFELYTVPEPGSLAILALGALGLCLTAWKRRQRA